MGMNPTRAGGSPAYALTQHGLVTSTDVYGSNTALLNPDGIVRGASGAPSSSFGSRMVTSVPPSLRGGSASNVSGAGGNGVPILGPLLSNVPGGSAVHLIVGAVIVLILLRFLMKEA